MFKDITIGQYVDTGSFLHKLDPRTKIILLILYIVLLFWISSPLSYVLVCAFVLFLVFVSKLSLKFIVRGLKPMLFILIFTMLINLFLTPGEILWSAKVLPFWTVSISREGAVLAVLMFLRLTLLVVMSSLLTLTTSPMSLTDGIEKLLRL